MTAHGEQAETVSLGSAPNDPALGAGWQRLALPRTDAPNARLGDAPNLHQRPQAPALGAGGEGQQRWQMHGYRTTRVRRRST